MAEKIFITLGSQKFQFNRLLIAVDKLCEKNIICGDDVFAQTGYSDYVPRNFSYNNSSIEKSSVWKGKGRYSDYSWWNRSNHRCSEKRKESYCSSTPCKIW